MRHFSYAGFIFSGYTPYLVHPREYCFCGYKCFLRYKQLVDDDKEVWEISALGFCGFMGERFLSKIYNVLEKKGKN